MNQEVFLQEFLSRRPPERLNKHIILLAWFIHSKGIPFKTKHTSMTRKFVRLQIKLPTACKLLDFTHFHFSPLVCTAMCRG